MDSRRFDAVARSFAAEGASRRAVVKAFTGGILGGLGALVGARQAAASHESLVRCCIYRCPNGHFKANCLSDPTASCPFQSGRCNITSSVQTPGCNACKERLELF